jgi:hypothetical protein
LDGTGVPRAVRKIRTVAPPTISGNVRDVSTLAMPESGIFVSDETLTR